MLITVFVDIETFHELVLERKDFDACLNLDEIAMIAVSVPIDDILTSSERDMVTVKNSRGGIVVGYNFKEEGGLR